MSTRKYGSHSELEKQAFRTATSSAEVVVQPDASASATTLTLPDVAGSDTIISRTSSDTLAGRLRNKHLEDDTVLFSDGANNDRLLRFQVDTTSAGTLVLRTPTLGPGTDTIATIGATQTLTGKTLNGVALLDADDSNTFTVVTGDLAADRVLTIPAVAANDTFVFEDEAQTLTTKTIDADQNVISNIENDNIKASAAIALDKLAALGNTNRALISDGSGFIAESVVTTTELGFVSGVTSSIQTQFAGKSNTALDNLSVAGLANESLLVGVDANSVESLPVGANGQLLTVVAGEIAWAAPAGGGNVSIDANTIDNRIIRGDTDATEVQNSGISINDDDVMGEVGGAVFVNLLDADLSVSSGRTLFHPNVTVDTGVTLTLDTGSKLTTFDSITNNGTIVNNGTICIA